MSKNPRLRLDRLLANLGYGSRRDVTKLVARKLVKLDGELLRLSETTLEITPDLIERLTVDGEPLEPLPGLTLLMNKPAGMSCSHREKGDLIYTLLPERYQARNPALASVGRLDKETTGLLLITDDGALLHQITSPKKKIKKVYRAHLDRPLNGSEAKIFASGELMLDGEKDPCLPATLEVHGSKEASLTIIEGRYHQVRRMFAAVGNHVNELRRESIGQLSLPANLAPGEFRAITPEELSLVFSD
jgi:16S rRNA pseudouridine516 synthase